MTAEEMVIKELMLCKEDFMGAADTVRLVKLHC
jgi:hypothetical protein